MKTPDLSELGMRALKEFAAWDERNRVRAALKKWMREAGYGRGETANPDDFDDEGRAELDALIKAAKATQRQLTSARASTRRYAERLMP